MAASEVYTLEQAEEDIAGLRGEVSMLDEILITSDVQTATLEASGAVTATGGTQAAPTLITTDSWNSLGTPANVTVTRARYKLLPFGFVVVQFNVNVTVAAATITFPNNVPAACFPDVDIRQPLSFNAAASAIPRAFVNSTNGQVQIVGLGGANVTGQIDGTFIYATS
jgi:hypothetical protein